MNESRAAALPLWSRLISGDSLDEDERQRLADLLQQDSALREEIEADATMDALLRFITDIRLTDDQFIQGVLDRCHAIRNRGVAVAVDVQGARPRIEVAASWRDRVVAQRW